ncbi:MAG: glycosyltransferase [Sulfuricella sp.]|nr:glycosyltransferase [Sulfuricella sp.]
MAKTDSYAYEIDLENEQTVAAKILRLVGKGKRVLELGMASGHMSRVMKEQLGCTVVGVEINGEAAEQGKPYCERVIVGDIEAFDLDTLFGADRFDVILSADVLEHLRDPWATLGKLKSFLKPDGQVVISLPNAGFHGLLAEMCDGKFSYRKKGLLDDTHLRFFTRRELDLLVLSAGLVPDAWDQALLGAEHSEFVQSWEKLPGELQGLLRGRPDGEVYQLIVGARLSDKDGWDRYLRVWEEREYAAGKKDHADLQTCRASLEEQSQRLRADSQHIHALEQQNQAQGQSIQELRHTLLEKDAKLDAAYRELDGYIRRQAANVKALLERNGGLAESLAQERATGAQLQHTVAARAAENARLAAQVADLAAQVHVFRTSRSWRITAPLRGLTQLLRGVDAPPPSLPATAPLPAEPLPSLLEAGSGFSLTEIVNCPDYRDFLACFRSCADLTDEVRCAMRAHIDSLSYQPRFTVRLSLLGLDDAAFQRVFDAVRYQLYPRWELWLVDGEWASKAQKTEILSVAKGDGRVHFFLGKVAGCDDPITPHTLLDGDFLVVADGREVPPELALYRLALFLNRTNPAISARAGGTAVSGSYAYWLMLFDRMNAPLLHKLLAASAAFRHKPLISVVMPVYNAPEKWLRRAIESVLKQLYGNWELCIADDCSSEPHVRQVLEEYRASDARIKVAFRTENGHISAASNSALALATGEYVALLDHDDELLADALLWVVEEINRHPDAELIYSDEDKLSVEGERYDHYFKPDWNPDLFLSQNYICHLAVYRTALLRDIGGFRVGFEGAQDYDLAIRFTEKIAPAQIRHIARVLYHWRAIPGSTADITLQSDAKPYAVTAALRCLEEHLARCGIAADVSEDEVATGNFRVRYQLPAEPPLVSLIILTRNGLALLRQCVESILDKTLYKNYEILIVDNGSDDPDTLAYLESLQERQVARVLRDDSPFNFPALNNRAVQEARGSIVGLLNNDIEVISPDWLGEMVSHALRPEIGAVGARLWYPNDTLQHGGVILVGGVAGHSHKHLPRGEMGYSRRAVLVQNFSAVTAACLVLRKSVYLEVGGMDAQLAVAFNDVDFCLRIREAGYRNLWTPYAELYHHESATRGFEDTPEKKVRFNSEIKRMKGRWGSLLENDPAYNPNLTLEYEDFSLSIPPRLLK